MMRPRVIVLLLLFVAFTPAAQAHTLGVDKADLVEMKDGSYHLVSHVPPRYQPLITAPELPARCAQQGDPRGARGDYEVRFIFTCESPLTADDEIILPWRREGAMITVTWLGEEPVTRFAGKAGGRHQAAPGRVPGRIGFVLGGRQALHAARNRAHPGRHRPSAVRAGTAVRSGRRLAAG